VSERIFGAYVWKHEEGQWLLQQNHPVLDAVTNFGTGRALFFLRAGSLPTLRVGDVHHTPSRDIHPAHLDAWYSYRLPKEYLCHYGEGLVLPDTERLQLIYLRTPYLEWIALAGPGVNEFPGDAAPSPEQCLVAALKARRYFLEDIGEEESDGNTS
jgi:hypothetical protein